MNSVLTGVIVTVVALVLVAAAVLAGRRLRRRMLDPPGVRSAAQALWTAAQALWTAGLAAPPLREGLTPRSAAQALPYLLALLETSGVVLCGSDGSVLGADGPGGHQSAGWPGTAPPTQRLRRHPQADPRPIPEPGPFQRQILLDVAHLVGQRGELAGLPERNPG
jgi:hypothetical protein